MEAPTMKRDLLSLLIVAFATIAGGCTHPSVAPATQASAPARSDLPGVIEGVIEFPRQTLVFKPTRDDITVACVVFTISSSHPVRVNGGDPDPYCAIHL